MSVHRILIVEDHDAFRSTLRRFLKTRYPEQVHVEEAENGQIAVEYCAASPPDIVLMDINMPVLDGVTACSRIKERHRILPVILYSSDPRTDRIRIDPPEDGFIMKHSVFERLTQEISKLLGQ